MAENWRRGIRTLNRFNLPREVPRPTAADHIELSAGQIERLNNLMPAVGACVFDGCLRGQWGELRGLITRGVSTITVGAGEKSAELALVDSRHRICRDAQLAADAEPRER